MRFRTISEGSAEGTVALAGARDEVGGLIGAGEEWKGQIDRQLADADIILLLVSADSLPPIIAGARR